MQVVSFTSAEQHSVCCIWKQSCIPQAQFACTLM